MKLKKTLALSLSAIMTLSAGQGVVFAAENERNSSGNKELVVAGDYYLDKDGYLEKRNEIDLSKLELSTSDGELAVSVNKNTSSALAAKKELLLYLEKDEEIKDFLIEEIEDNENDILCALAYTEAPLKWVDNHYERISAEDISDVSSVSLMATDTGDQRDKGNFSLVTVVKREDSAVGSGTYKGKYKYKCKSVGVWSKNSALGGSDYPAAYDDQLIQTQPKSLTRQSDTFSMNFNNSRTAAEGTDYHLEDGNSRYVQYSITDDPVGPAQMTDCKLKTVNYGNKGKERRINSYYVHTWGSTSISFSISANTEKSFGILLSLTPTTKSWKVYSYVETSL